MPDVSVILDNFNYAEYLSAAIESVLGQNYQDLELIVVDDGSTDNSKEIIQSYASKSSKVIPVFKENGGQTSAFNAGFARTSGRIVAFLDSDDYWYPNKLERIVEAHRTSKIIQHYLTANGEGIYRKITSKVDWSSALTKYGYMYNHCPTSGLSFDRELIAQFFPLEFEQEMRGYTDGCLLMLAMTKSTVLCIDDVLGFYRIHNRNLNANQTDTGDAARQVLERQREYVNKQLEQKHLPKISFDNHAYFTHLLQQNFNAGELVKDMPVAVYGTGSSGWYMRKSLESLGIPIWGYVDSNSSMHGKIFEDKRICCVEKLQNYREYFQKIIIASSAQEAIKNNLIENQFSTNEIIALPI